MEMKLLLVHRFTLYTHSLHSLIHNNCIVNTLPDTYFACYWLAPDDGKCTNCMLHNMLHGIWQLIVLVWISFLLVSAEFYANLSFYPCPHISWFCGLDNLPSFSNCSCILVLNCEVGVEPTYLPWSNMFFYNCQTRQQILIIVLNKMQ